MKKGQLTDKTIEKIYKMTKLYGRTVKKEPLKNEAVDKADVEEMTDDK